MSKERISASVDPEVDAYLSRETVNASGLINQLVKQQMSAGDDSKQLLQLRLEQINSEIDRHESQLETLEKEREGVKKRLEKIKEEEHGQRQKTLERLETVPWKEDNPAIKTNAEDLGMEPHELINELEDYHAE
jgi:chromosome segregation ATPase